jgi:hypothetical protein
MLGAIVHSHFAFGGQGQRCFQGRGVCVIESRSREASSSTYDSYLLSANVQQGTICCAEHASVTHERPWSTVIRLLVPRPAAAADGGAPVVLGSTRRVVTP